MNTYTPTRFSEELVSRLRGQIARFDVNQAQLALLCGVSQSQFSKIIRGVRPISLDQVVIICEALNIDVDELIQQVENFVGAEGIHASPIRFVSDERRLDTHDLVDFNSLDTHGQKLMFEWDTSPEIVGGSADNDALKQSDMARAAFEDDGDEGASLDS